MVLEGYLFCHFVDLQKVGPLLGVAAVLQLLKHQQLQDILSGFAAVAQIFQHRELLTAVQVLQQTAVLAVFAVVELPEPNRDLFDVPFDSQFGRVYLPNQLGKLVLVFVDFAIVENLV